MLELINIEQGSTEWHELRAKHFKTASRTPAMMGFSPFQSKEKLLSELAGDYKPFFSNAMRQGVELEDMVRELVEEKMGEPFEPQVGVNDGYLASLDGINFDGDTIVEIKVSKHTFQKLKDGNIPKNYLYQIHHQMMVFDSVLRAYLVAYNPDTKELIMSESIIRDENAFAQIKEAWQNYDTDMEEYIKNRDDVDNLPEVITDVDIVELADELESVIAKKKELEAIEKALKLKLTEHAGNTQTIISNLTISRGKGRKTFNYSKLIDDKNISTEELEKYAKIGKESLTFRFSKSE